MNCNKTRHPSFGWHHIILLVLLLHSSFSSSDTSSSSSSSTNHFSCLSNKPFTKKNFKQRRILNYAATNNNHRHNILDFWKFGTQMMQSTTNKFHHHKNNKYNRLWNNVWKKNQNLLNIRLTSSCLALVSSAWFFYPRHARAATTSTTMQQYHDKMKWDEVIGRSLYFWRKSGPIICHYRWAQLWMNTIMKKKYSKKERRDVIYQQLHLRYAPRTLQIILDMKGLFIKIGQILSSRPDFVPKEYVDLLSSVVQDTIPVSFSPQQVHDILQQSFQSYLNLNLEDIFESIDYNKPLGNASIGQVHNAILKQTQYSDNNNNIFGEYSGGRDVAIKLMHSDAKDRFQNDFRIFKWLCRVALPGWKPILVEVERQMMTEFDYCNEANNLQTVKHNMSQSPYAHQVVVPEPVISICTPNVLIMQLLHGTKLAEAAEQKLSTILNGNKQLARSLIHEKRRELFEGTEPSNKRTWMEEYKDLCQHNQFSLWKRLLMPIQLYNFAKSQEQTLDLLLDVHGHQIFQNGCFNGDPHPGNIMELEDGRLGLIDYGQCKRLTESERLSLARVVSKLNGPDSQENEKSVADAMRDFGFRFKHTDEHHIVTKTAKLFFDSDSDGRKIGCTTPQIYFLYLQARNPMEHVPDAAVLVARTSFLFRGMGALLGKQLETSKRWAKHAQLVLQEKS